MDVGCGFCDFNDGGSILVVSLLISPILVDLGDAFYDFCDLVWIFVFW